MNDGGTDREMKGLCAIAMRERNIEGEGEKTRERDCTGIGGKGYNVLNKKGESVSEKMTPVEE